MLILYKDKKNDNKSRESEDLFFFTRSTFKNRIKQTKIMF